MDVRALGDDAQRGFVACQEPETRTARKFLARAGALCRGTFAALKFAWGAGRLRHPFLDRRAENAGRDGALCQQVVSARAGGAAENNRWNRRACAGRAAPA
jgi:hypothetical protein